MKNSQFLTVYHEFLPPSNIEYWIIDDLRCINILVSDAFASRQHKPNMQNIRRYKLRRSICPHNTILTNDNNLHGKHRNGGVKLSWAPLQIYHFKKVTIFRIICGRIVFICIFITKRLYIKSRSKQKTCTDKRKKHGTLADLNFNLEIKKYSDNHLVVGDTMRGPRFVCLFFRWMPSAVFIMAYCFKASRLYKNCVRNIKELKTMRINSSTEVNFAAGVINMINKF